MRRTGSGVTVRAFLFACIATACGMRSQDPNATRGASNEGTIPQGAVAVAPPVDNAGQPGECTVGTPFSLSPGSAGVLGVWRDPIMQQVFVANRMAPNEAAISQVAIPDGTITRLRTVTTMPESTILSAWRAHSGDLMFGVRMTDGLHLAREHAFAVTEIPFSRYYTPANDTALGPLDDPSDSQAAGLLSSSAGYAGYSSMCAVDTTASSSPLFCSHYWPAASQLRRVMFGPATSNATVARGHTYGSASATVVVSRGASYSWESLGRMPTSGTGYGGYGYARRTAVTDTSRGGPMAVPAGSGAAVAWCDTQGSLQIQAVGSTGNPTADPVMLPFVDVRIEDFANIGGELFLTLTTRADRTATPATTTLVRLEPTLNSQGPVTTAPIRIPLSAARIVPVNGPAVMFWSPDAANALVANCRLTTR